MESDMEIEELEKSQMTKFITDGLLILILTVLWLKFLRMVIDSFGFGERGVKYGSFAAFWNSLSGRVQRGGLFANLQSIGHLGFSFEFKFASYFAIGLLYFNLVPFELAVLFGSLSYCLAVAVHEYFCPYLY